MDTTPFNEEETLDKLEAAYEEPALAKPRRYNDQEWNDLQRARQAYLKEWEEDMRYAQELASEGM